MITAIGGSPEVGMRPVQRGWGGEEAFELGPEEREQPVWWRGWRRGSLERWTDTRKRLELRRRLCIESEEPHGGGAEEGGG